MDKIDLCGFLLIFSFLQLLPEYFTVKSLKDETVVT